MLSQRGAALKKLADAAGPLYKSLDEARSTASSCWRGSAVADTNARARGWMHRGPGGFGRGPRVPTAARGRNSRRDEKRYRGRGVPDTQPPS